MKLKHVIGQRVAIYPDSMKREVNGIHLGETALDVRKVGEVVSLGTDINDSHNIKVGDRIIYSKTTQDVFLDDVGKRIELVDVRNIYAVIEY
jgi:co-chaperonin GroES (HSP10)